MLTVAPPTKPRALPKLGGREVNYFTLHSSRNNAFTLRVNEHSKTSIVGFRSRDDAVLIGGMIEAYIQQKKEWPDLKVTGSLVLPSAQGRTQLDYIFIEKWKFNELKMLCTRNVMDFLAVESLTTIKDGFSFSGNQYLFEAPPEFYQARFDELYLN